jgi:predicted chitinase
MNLKQNILLKSAFAPDYSGSPEIIKAIFSKRNRATRGSSYCDNRKQAFIMRAIAKSWKRHKKQIRVKAITGNTTLKVGNWSSFHVSDWYKDTPLEERNEAFVKWVLYHLKDGITPVKILEKDNGDFRFQQGAVGEKYLVVAYMYEPELKTGLEITVLDNNVPEILGINITDVDDQPFSGPIYTGQTINCHARTVGMVGHHVVFSLWEDNDDDSTNNDDNSKHKLVQEKITRAGSKGVAHAQFQVSADFKKLSEAAMGNGSAKKQYYITAFGMGLLKPGAGTTLVYPDERKAITKDHLAGKKPEKDQVPPYKEKIVLKPKGEKKTVKTSSYSTQHSTTKKITNVLLLDEQYKPITNTYNSKTLIIQINSQGLINHKVQVRLYDQDVKYNDLLIDQEFTITRNDYKIKVFLDRIPRSKGGEYWEDGAEQELFANIKVKDLNLKLSSVKIDVDAGVFKVEVDKSNKPVVSEGGKKPEKKDEKKGNCFCNRDITVTELTKMVKNIRDNTFYDGKTITYYHGDKLFYVYSKVPKSDQNITKFAEVINKAFAKYEINTCARKIHFLANMYVETMYFTATREGKGISGFRYDPYRGRGFQHLTWESNYEEYKKISGIDIVTDYEKVANDLNIAADSGAWYWKKAGINKYADKDSIFDTSRLINYPGAVKSSSINGYKDREIAWQELKKIFKYPQDCINNKTTKPIKENCTNCNVEHYDLTDKVKWQTQFDTKWGDKSRQNVACKKTCDDILNKSGLASTSILNKYQTASENSKHTILVVDTETSKTAIKYLDLQLKAGNPVQVGVDHALNYKGGSLNEGTTDHFIVIVGKSCENGKVFYRFYDVGTKHESKGASENNRLYLNLSDYSLKGKTVYNGSVYTVTQIRNNKKI